MAIPPEIADIWELVHEETIMHTSKLWVPARKL